MAFPPGPSFLSCSPPEQCTHQFSDIWHFFRAGSSLIWGFHTKCPDEKFTIWSTFTFQFITWYIMLGIHFDIISQGRPGQVRPWKTKSELNTSCYIFSKSKNIKDFKMDEIGWKKWMKISALLNASLSFFWHLSFGKVPMIQPFWLMWQAQLLSNLCFIVKASSF